MSEQQRQPEDDHGGPFCTCGECAGCVARAARLQAEAVNHPQHYRSGGLEAIDVIEAFGLNFNLGNTAKYVLRAGRKGAAVEDLKKARWYLDREIANRMAAATPKGETP